MSGGIPAVVCTVVFGKRRFMSRLFPYWLVMFLCAACMDSAFAHAHLKAETPAQDTVVNVSPAALRLEFSEGLELAFTTVKLLDVSGKSILTGQVSLAPGDAKVLLVPLPARLAAGVYQVQWQALSIDGHKTNGNYRFTLQSE